MKKLVVLSIIILFLTCIHSTIYADALNLHSSTAMITNRNGAICYRNETESDCKIPYGTVIRIYWLDVDTASYLPSDYVFLSTGNEFAIKTEDIELIKENNNDNNIKYAIIGGVLLIALGTIIIIGMKNRKK